MCKGSTQRVAGGVPTDGAAKDAQQLLDDTVQTFIGVGLSMVIAQYFKPAIMAASLAS